MPKTHVAPHETRGLDAVRYELSKPFPDLVREFDGKRVAQTRTGPLVRVTLADGRDYANVFTLKKVAIAWGHLWG